ncbi:MAG: YhbY family RNA-binding protein, partial [Thermoplasmata archaeon]
GRWKRRIRAESHYMKPTCHIGKNGITDAVVAEIKMQAKKNRIVKVRLLSSAIENNESGRKGMAEEIAHRTRMAIIEVKGNVITLCKKK